MVHRVIRNATFSNNRWHSQQQDIFGCIDILAKRTGERMRFIQITASRSISDKAARMAAVPWDTCYESVEIWRWVAPRAPGQPGYFQIYLLDEEFEYNAANRRV